MDILKNGNRYDAVITVCSPAADRRCPVFPGRVLRLNWSFAGPSSTPGSDEDRLACFREIRDLIKTRVQEFVRDFTETKFKIHLLAEDSWRIAP